MDFKDSEKENIKRENNDIHEFLKALCVDGSDSFQILMCRIGDQIERSGNSFVEILRDSKNDIVGLNIIDSTQMRIKKSDIVFTEKKYYDKDTKSWKTKLRPQTFKTFVRIINGEYTYFKEFSDPRVVNFKTGKAYSQMEYDKLKKSDKKEITIAHEIYHFKLPNIKDGYGLPRFTNAFNPITSNILIEENQIRFLKNGMKSPLFLMTNGSISKESLDSIIDLFNSDEPVELAYINVEEDATLGIPSSERNVDIKIKELTSREDGTFLELFKMNNELIISSCGLTALDIGLNFQSKNKKESDTTEQNTFEPARQIISDFLSVIFSEKNYKYHIVKWQSSTKQSIEDRINNILKLLSVLTGRELRQEITNNLGLKLTDIEADWIDLPLQFIIAGREKILEKKG